MRFDTPIYFQTIKMEYDASTGNYTDNIVAMEMRYAAVTDSTTEMLSLVYGGLKQGSKTIRLQNHYTKPFDRIKIGEKFYHVDKSRSLRQKQILIVSEVQ